VNLEAALRAVAVAHREAAVAVTCDHIVGVLEIGADGIDAHAAPRVGRSSRSSRRRRMEPLWSPVVATSGNRRQIVRWRKRQKQAKSVATGCHRLPATFHGKEGVDGSSPSEGFTKGQQVVFVGLAGTVDP